MDPSWDEQVPWGQRWCLEVGKGGRKARKKEGQAKTKVASECRVGATCSTHLSIFLLIQTELYGAPTLCQAR